MIQYDLMRYHMRQSDITINLMSTLCYYQVHHHVHRADFDRVDSVNKLPDLFKGGSVGGVMRATSPDQLRKHKWDKRRQKDQSPDLCGSCTEIRWIRYIELQRLID